MSRTNRALPSAFGVMAGALGIFAASSVAGAQRQPVMARAASPAPVARPVMRFPGTGVRIDPRSYDRRPHDAPSRRRQRQGPLVVYVPVPSGYPYYAPVGNPYYPQPGAVYDVNGRPLSSGFDASEPGRFDFLGGTDLSGSPFVVGDGGVMLVDFGNGDRRSVPSCAALESARTPDGQSRTIFYRPAADALVLRAGQSGRVIGAPPAGASICYGADRYGRTVLEY